MIKRSRNRAVRSAARILIVATAVVVLAGGCATTQILHISSTPRGAFVLVNGERVAVTPADIEVRKNPPPTIAVEKDSFVEQTIALQRGFDPSAVSFSLLAGALIGAAAYAQSANLLGSWNSRGTVAAGGIGMLIGAGGYLIYSALSGSTQKYSRLDYNVILQPRQQ
jgi:hypothetical protein